MNNLYHLPNTSDPEAISEQAIEWFARLRREGVTAEDHAAFKHWYENNPQHKQAFEEVAAFWADADFTALLSNSALSKPEQEYARPDPKPSTHKPPVPYVKVGLSLAACMALALVIYQPTLNCLHADYCTSIGEIRQITLADGSQITLNSNTALKVSYDQNQRNIKLQQGEALFEVTRNPEQPFVVNAHFSDTRVLGTRFIIREEPATDTVSVINGIVAVSQADQKPAILKANDQIVVGQSQISSIEHLSSDVNAAWVKGRLLFDNAPLEKVISEISRYRHGKVYIKNAALKNLKVSGRFDISNTDNALESLQQTLPISIYRLTPWLVIIS